MSAVSVHTAHYTATRQSGNNLYLPHSSTQDQPRLGKTEKHHLFCKKREEGGRAGVDKQTINFRVVTHSRRPTLEVRRKAEEQNVFRLELVWNNGGQWQFAGPWTLSWVGAIRAETSEQTLTDHRVMMIHPDNCQSQAAPASASPDTNTTIKLAEEKHALLLTLNLYTGYFYRMRCLIFDWLGLVLRWRAPGELGAGDTGDRLPGLTLTAAN